MIVGNYPIQITIADDPKPYTPRVYAQALRGGGAEIAVTLGSTYLSHRITPDEARALAEWLTRHATA